MSIKIKKKQKLPHILIQSIGQLLRAEPLKALLWEKQGFQVIDRAPRKTGGGSREW